MDGYDARLDWATDTLLAKLAAIGPERVTLAAQMVKLQDELDECREEIAAPLQPGRLLAELADVVIVCNTAARLAGFSSTELRRAVADKSFVNANREWYPTASGTARHAPEVPSEAAEDAPRRVGWGTLVAWLVGVSVASLIHPALGWVVAGVLVGWLLHLLREGGQL